MTLLDRKIPPTFKTIDNISFPWPTTVKTDVGIPLFILNQGDMPIIKLSLLSEAGSWYEPQNGVAYFAAKMLTEGTLNKTAQEIAAYIDYYGANLTIITRVDYCSIELVCLSKHFVVMLDLLTELLTTSTFPQTQLNLLQKLRVQALKVEDEKNSQVAHKRFKEALLGKAHPYGYSLTAADIATVTTDHLVSFYKNQLLADCQVLLSGQVKEQHIQYVQQLLSHIPSKPANRPNYPLSIKPPSRIHVQKEGSLQSAICIGKLLFPKTHPDYLAMYIVTELLGGYFGSRLMRNIREEKGYTYNIYATMLPLKETTYFLISTEAIQEFAEQTCEEIYREIKILQTEEVDLEELTTLKNYMIGNFLTSINDPFSIMQRFKEAHLYGLAQEFYEDFYHTLQQITPARIKEIANTYLALESLTEVRVG
ncbi:MAG: M16 family metallopeptidase [Candidatus Amoebophilus sp.]